MTTALVQSYPTIWQTDWEAMLIRNGYDHKDLAVLLTAKPEEIKLLLRGELEPARTDERRAQLRAGSIE